MKEEEMQKSLSIQEAGVAENINENKSSSHSGVESMQGFEPVPGLKHETGTDSTPGSEPATVSVSPEGSKSASGSKPGSKAKLVAFSLMLAVPAVIAGCGSNDECDPQYDEGCEYDSSSGHYYYGGYGGSSYRSSKDGSSSYKSSSKSKSSGFGSFFRSSGG
ncbi:hypothetical protein GCM10008014_46410 [Paenibacillus silvae]|uniref:Aminotransferase yhxA n=1 Tax=Paenibacillus silvae TaxID=1325358 RepID=A0ABQ1ZJ76_9BACL|nr:hypothetical protein [Paenibacillus silvae]GGH66226.1 hypothetical protein GCM10008014_46410 [Paenibacillus silvae]